MDSQHVNLLPLCGTITWAISVLVDETRRARVLVGRALSADDHPSTQNKVKQHRVFFRHKHHILVRRSPFRARENTASCTSPYRLSFSPSLGKLVRCRNAKQARLLCSVFPSGQKHIHRENQMFLNSHRPLRLSSRFSDILRYWLCRRRHLSF